MPPARPAAAAGQVPVHQREAVGPGPSVGHADARRGPRPAGQGGMLAGDRRRARRHARDRLQAARSTPRRCAPRRSTAASRTCWCGTRSRPGTSSTSRRTPCTRSAAAARSSRSSRTRTSPTASTTTAARASCISTRRSRWRRASRTARRCAGTCPPGDVTLVDGPYFRLDQVEGLPSTEQAARYRGCLLVIPRTGKACVEDEPVLPGPVRAGAFARRRGVRSEGQLPDRAALRGALGCPPSDAD